MTYRPELKVDNKPLKDYGDVMYRVHSAWKFYVKHFRVGGRPPRIPSDERVEYWIDLMNKTSVDNGVHNIQGLVFLTRRGRL